MSNKQIKNKQQEFNWLKNREKVGSFFKLSSTSSKEVTMYIQYEHVTFNSSYHYRLQKISFTDQDISTSRFALRNQTH